MALITRIKNWIDRECLTHTDLNAEFSNITDNAATKEYVDDNVGSNLWTDEGTYYYPSNWAYMRILDSNRLDIANPTAFTGGFPWNDNVTYSSSAGSMVNLGQESSSDGNPPLWVQKKFNKSSGSNTYFAGAGHFEVWKQSGATKSYVSALTGMITQECASGDAVGIHGRVKKSAGGSGWAGWLTAYRQAGATTGSLYGLEVNVINNANPETFANTVASPADMALLLHATNSAHPSIAAMVIGADSVTNTFYNGILFNTSGVRNVAGKGVGINMYGVSPQYGIKFSANSTAHIYYADTADGLRLLSDGHTISTNANSKSWYWRCGGDCMILSPSGNLSLDGTLTENAWTLDNKHMGRKWELIDSIRKAYMTHDGKKLDAVLQIKTKTKDKNDKTQIKYGKRPSDFIQIAIECIAELKERIAVLEKA